MKKTPQEEKLEEVLYSSKIVAGGFMGTDSRSLHEIIDSDAAVLEKLNYSHHQIAERMRQITDVAKAALGNPVKVDENIQVRTEEAKGPLICPWPHPGAFAKRVTIVKNTSSNKTIKWSDLNIHLIDEHHFFEGKGAAYRLEPEKLIDIIF
jgi:hypothetical protein